MLMAPVEAPNNSAVCAIESRFFGKGECYAHHGEILQGVFRSGDGKATPGLVTLPYRAVKTVATFFPKEGAPLRVVPEDRVKAFDAAKLALSALGRDTFGGTLTIYSNVPIGAGMGSSTADVTATARAVLNAFGVEMGALSLAKLAVQAEAASDPVMIPEAVVLFAQRSGNVIEHMPGKLPPMLAVGVNTAPNCLVDTLAIPSRERSEQEIEEYEFLRAQLRRALARADACLLGYVATQSALLNRSIKETPRLDDLLTLQRDLGAEGVQIAHSGTVAALLFDARHDEAKTRGHLAAEAAHEAGFAPGPLFRI